ncbi:maestro heat-like repeat-containing protein family member 1-like [Patagioenas fasciata monilis]|uniref:Maestro heat-like repeat-containing protein family member 1-like n=1 Tax=Patagioenas fasciata monilis TaxID=372326 RepID=A0A1V4JZF5_PATFA|nr:maestro heat-like repeat-containing protein family member 1-like [Patagioenas fasciata monilis]
MTESRVKRLATTLMDATTDKAPLVQEQIYKALCELGESEPEEILNACDEYLRQHDKLAYPHRVIILKAMETVVKNNIALLDKSTAKVVIFLASNEMTKSKEVIRDWQQAASSVLVAVGQRFINKVMEEVLSKFQPGILPHYFVVQTFANLSVSNVFGMVPFLNSILGTMLPMLGMAKQDHMKSVFCYGCGARGGQDVPGLLVTLEPCGLGWAAESWRSVQRLLPFTQYGDSAVHRRGIVGALRNCCFEHEDHEWLLSEEVDILPFLLLPLAGPEELPEDEMERLPPELQYLPQDKRREEEPDIRKMLLESIMLVALQHFSESIQEYLANLDKAPDPTVRKDTFSNEIFSAYEVLFTAWLQHREAKLRVAVVEALGPMSHLLPADRLEEQLPRLIPAILALYKKHTEAFYISKSLCQILEASVDIGSRSLDVQLEPLLGTLHPQPPAASANRNPRPGSSSYKRHRYHACSFPDRVLAFLLPKLESSGERTRVGTLLIMRQIINSAPSQMEIKKPFILSSMRLPLQDTNNKVS